MNEVEKELTNEIKHAIDRGTLDDVVKAWTDYYGYVIKIDSMKKKYDSELYKKFYSYFQEWKDKNLKRKV